MIWLGGDKAGRHRALAIRREIDSSIYSIRLAQHAQVGTLVRSKSVRSTAESKLTISQAEWLTRCPATTASPGSAFGRVSSNLTGVVSFWTSGISFVDGESKISIFAALLIELEPIWRRFAPRDHLMLDHRSSTALEQFTTLQNLGCN